MKQKKKRNTQDLTLRNLRAMRKEISQLKAAQNVQAEALIYIWKRFDLPKIFDANGKRMRR